MPKSQAPRDRVQRARILRPRAAGRARSDQRPAVNAADWALWAAGTALGLVTTAWIPYLMFTRYEISPDAAFGGWLMPVVPPMVSAANGALLIPYAGPGQGRLTLLLACYAMFGISLFASVIITTQIWSRLAHYKIGPAAMVPTLWIVLGPLGQSVTAAGNLGNQAATVLRGPVLRGSRRLRPAVRRANLGVRHAVARGGRSDHRADHPAAAAFHPDLVELHVPCGDVRHRHHRAGGPQ
jgi:voltage-gated anion channel